MSTVFLIKWGGVLMCMSVLIGCVCRVNMMHSDRHKFGWFAMYAIYAVYAGGVLIDLLLNRWVDWYEAAGLAGVLLHLVMTRKLWSREPPPETVKKVCICVR